MVVVEDKVKGDEGIKQNKRYTSSQKEKGKEVVTFNPFDALNSLDDAEENTRGPNTCSPYSSDPYSESLIITIVYGASEMTDRRSLWNTLKILAREHSDEPWLVGGDFNAVREMNEVCGASLVPRLSVVLDKIISPCQGAFIPGRSIGDNILLAQELLTGYNQVRLPPRCTLNVDSRKAYDTVEWDFLLAVLQFFGFPQTLTRWIEECVTTTAFSIGLNGNPHSFFVGARGLRQGDPLSPYLFVLVMEVLHLGLLQLIEQDLQFSYYWKCEPAKVFQLGFADDLLLFCRADLNSLRILKRGLDRFAEWSGLRLNVQKSHVIISRSAQDWKDQILIIMGFQEGQLPMRYLGLPLLSSRLSISDCQPLLLKIDARINGWEGISLSYAGRIQIIKSVLSAMSIYWASAFILPKAVIKKIEKRLRTFLWKGTSTSGYAKVVWKDVCKPIKEGGQGIKDIGILNRSLIANKLCDVIRCDRTSIWGGSWGWWKLLRLRSSILPMTEFLIGEGRSFYLWKDPWHHLGPLIARLPRGPSLLGFDESAKLQDQLAVFRGTTHYTIPMLFCPPGPKVGWSSLLSGSLKIPLHNFILWFAIQEKLSTTNKPWMTHLGGCILCDEGAAETHTHMFFQCRYSRGCLAAIRHHIRFAWPNREWTRDVEWASRKWRGKHIVNVAYRALLGACIYHIWRERNLRRFEHTHRLEAVLATCIIEDVRQRIISINLFSSISTCALYRLWRIPWSVGGTTI
ncbi:UNVERIFIED_CONTAM: hypothetical protein Sindi_1684500 [Sesamum indicum]